MRTIFAAALCAVFLGGLVTGCARPSPEQCREACQKARALAKADFDKRTADLPEALSRQAWTEALEVLDDMVETCQTACLDAGDIELTTCLAGAKDTASWKACITARSK